ncbi:hypothetical protein Cni_G14762 [Canna indica]|uniref:Uncharacterized protein n=1 Tax=Canna indica TaxID=4628 RepID=A0AAQ3QF26_9LILI|nr:hypothetical protein Cni_G14762 [Canna indica]
MGLCFSKKEEASLPIGIPTPTANPNEKRAEKKPPQIAVEAAASTEKKQVFVITHSTNKSAAVAAADNAAADNKEKKRVETPTKKLGREIEANGAVPVMVVEEFKPAAGIRTSSCTKEEVDAILIQCGRLSRSSSGKAPNENGAGHHRRHSGSKRSYDFDNERKGEEDGDEWGERPVSRPSPRRRTPSRERSGSRERGTGSGGGRRVSRSPGRRSEAPASSATASEKSRQPAKMVAVPAREKGRGVSPAAANRRGGETGPAVRSASPRSRSPASTTRMFNENAHHVPPSNQPQSLSRSSSRKAEHSPYRRNPMAEIDDNILRANQHANTNSNKIQKTREGEEGMRKPSQTQAQKSSENIAQGSRSLQRNGPATTELTNAAKSSNLATSTVREQLMSCRGKEQQQQQPQQMESSAAKEAVAMDKASSKVTEISSLGGDSQNPKTITRTRSSRRSSRDLDHALGLNQESFLNPNSYVSSLLLDDIQTYNQQHPNAAFSLPACVSKACSILEAVADLNSTSSENKSLIGDHSSNDGRQGWRSLAANEPFVESEIVAKDDLLEPSLQKYVTMRDFGGVDMEPQESAGSNSFAGQPWSSSWEPNSADSTDRYWTSRSNNGDEVEQEETKMNSLSHQSQYQRQQQQTTQESESRGTRRSRGAASGNSGGLPAPATPSKNRRNQLHRVGAGAKAGSRLASASS